ncbi:hypothetical protein [Pseudactinotalea terrae]|uniref:hypothetical protein n=1 Tax=Pseudactinotalea terrae TaxID=1743262 RepID=UPI0012E26035|nr:hypothetical protein [Pseudactinotalea terrae]
MYALIFNLIPIVGALVIGAVMAPKAGPAKGKMWLGLALIVAGAVLSLIWQAVLIAPVLHSMMWDRGVMGISVISGGIALVNTVLLLLGLYFLCAAVVMGRSGAAYLDPSRPGAPPSTYPAGGEQSGARPSSGPGSNPYV